MYAYSELQSCQIGEMVSIETILGEKVLKVHGIVGAPLGVEAINEMVMFFVRGIQHYNIKIPKEEMSLREVYKACEVMYGDTRLESEEVLQNIMIEIVKEQI